MFEAHLICEISNHTTKATYANKLYQNLKKLKAKTVLKIIPDYPANKLLISFHKIWTCRSTPEISQDIVGGHTDTANSYFLFNTHFAARSFAE